MVNLNAMKHERCSEQIVLRMRAALRDDAAGLAAAAAAQIAIATARDTPRNFGDVGPPGPGGAISALMRPTRSSCLMHFHWRSGRAANLRFQVAEVARLSVEPTAAKMLDPVCWLRVLPIAGILLFCFASDPECWAWRHHKATTPVSPVNA